MQDPLMSALRPQNQPADQGRPDPLTSPVGLLYPRWPLLSAIMINVAGIVGYLLWRFVSCPVDSLGFLRGLCSTVSWNVWMQFLSIWGFFLLTWLLAWIFGYGTIEGSRPSRARIRAFMRSATDFEPIRWLLFIYGGLASLCIIAMLLLNALQPVPAALSSIIVFVTIWVFVRRPRRQPRQLSEQEQLQESLRASVSPWYVFCSLPLIRGILRPSPRHIRQGNAGGQLTP